MKKRLLGWLLVLTMVVGILPAAVFAEEATSLEITEKMISNFENNMDASFEFEVENTSMVDVEAYLLTALYNGNEMVTYNYLKKTIGTGETETWGSLIQIPATGTYQVKVFAWDNLTSPTTLSNVVEVSMGDVVVNFATVLDTMEAAHAVQTISQGWENIGLDGVDFVDEDNIVTAVDNAVDVIAAASSASNVMKAIFTLAMLDYDPTDIVLADGTAVNGVDVLNNLLASTSGNLYASGMYAQILELWGGELDTTTNLNSLVGYLTTAVASESNYSWGIDGGLMGLFGLAPYYNQGDTTIDEAVDAALAIIETYISASGGLDNSNTDAMIIIAYTMLGKDPGQLLFTDGTSVVDDLMDLLLEDGSGFGYTSNATINLSSTKQGMVALKSLVCFEETKGAPVNPFDLTATAVNQLDLEPITVTVNISKNGEFLTGTGDVTMAGVSVELDCIHNSLDIDGALAEAHVLYYDGDGYATSTGDYGLYISGFWGEAYPSVGYYVDGASAWSLADPVSDGAVIDAFIYGGDYYAGTMESYAKFNTIPSVTAGEAITITLLEEYYEGWSSAFKGCEGATIYINGVATEYVTDASGEVEITFDTAGDYWLTAKKDTDENGITDIVAPYAAVTVAAAASRA